MRRDEMLPVVRQVGIPPGLQDMEAPGPVDIRMPNVWSRIRAPNVLLSALALKMEVDR